MSIGCVTLSRVTLFTVTNRGIIVQSGHCRVYLYESGWQTYTGGAGQWGAVGSQGVGHQEAGQAATLNTFMEQGRQGRAGQGRAEQSSEQ